MIQCLEWTSAAMAVEKTVTHGNLNGGGRVAASTGLGLPHCLETEVCKSPNDTVVGLELVECLQVLGKKTATTESGTVPENCMCIMCHKPC